MNKASLRIIEFGDVHLGHPHTTTIEIITRLRECFSTIQWKSIDLVFIAGDVFDRLLHLPDLNVIEIRLWIVEFLTECQHHDVCVRVLEGTPSHDWKQSRLFTHLNEIAQIGADVLYFDYLTIEYLAKFDITVLYIPDEWKPECDDIWKEVTKTLKEHNLEKVDFTLMHGSFDYQLPPNVPAPTHNPHRYLSITRYLVFIGHVHKFSREDRIIAAGSFDRLCHGEEEAKGIIDAKVYKEGYFDITFIENKQAKQYKTIDCTHLKVHHTLKHIERELKQLPPLSHVRIQASKDDAILVSLDTLRKKYPSIYFTTKVEKGEVLTEEFLIDLKRKYQPISITKDNIKRLLLDRIQLKQVDSPLLDTIGSVLDEHISPP